MTKTPMAHLMAHLMDRFTKSLPGSPQRQMNRYVGVIERRVFSLNSQHWASRAWNHSRNRYHFNELPAIARAGMWSLPTRNQSQKQSEPRFDRKPGRNTDSY